jgi:hypothetical protein
MHKSGRVGRTPPSPGSPRANSSTPTASRARASTPPWIWPKSREVDCVWPDRRLVAELDGCATHGTRGAYEDDRVLPVAGYRVIRIAWRHPIEDGPVLGAQIRALLA